jgi:hypothetical protein
MLMLALLALPVAAQAQDQQIDASAIYSSGDLTLGPAGGDVLPDNDAVNLGSNAAKYLTLHAAELWVQQLIAADTMATIGGRVLIAPTTTLVADLTDSATTIHVKHNNLASGDRVVLESGGSLEWMAVTSSASGSAGNYSYTVTRNLDGSGANAWASGDAVMDSGASGDGYIDLYSVSGLVPGDSAGPTIVGDVRTGTTWNAVAPRWAIGNLEGLYGYDSAIYGAAFGDPSGAWLKIDATNGVRMGYDATTKISIDAAGNADITGALTAGSITTDKLAVGGMGAALNDDPSVSSLASWTNVGAGSLAIASVTDGQVGTTTLRSGTGLASAFVGSRFVAIDPAKTYRVHAWARKSSTANGTLFLGLQIRDASGANVTGPFGTYWYLAASAQSGSTSWTEYVGTIGPNSTTSFPSNGRTMAPLGLLNFGGSAGYFEVQDVRLEEVLPGTLIQDGVVTTTKLAANAVTAAKIAAGTITATEIAANAITSSKLAANSVTSDKIVAGTIVASDIASGTITADRLNVSTLSAITANLGTVTAGTINGVTIIGGTLTAGSGSEVFLSSDGITIEDGTSDRNAVKWGDGSSKIWGTSTDLSLLADNEIVIGCCGIAVTVDRAHSSINIDGSIFNGALGGTGTRHVCAESTGKIVICP